MLRRRAVAPLCQQTADRNSPQRTLIFAAALFAVSLASHYAVADSADARCDIYPKGEDYATASIPCVFSQRQGYITIRRSNGDSVTSPGGGKIRVQKQSDEWTVTIDDTEAYLIVDAVILGG